jgi:hypothetical protein
VGQKIGQPVLVVIGDPSPLADEGAVGAGGRDRPDDVGGTGLGEPGAQGPLASQGARDPTFVSVAVPSWLVVDRGDLGVGGGGGGQDLVDRSAAGGDEGGDRGEPRDLPAGVGLRSIACQSSRSASGPA